MLRAVIVNIAYIIVPFRNSDKNIKIRNVKFFETGVWADVKSQTFENIPESLEGRLDTIRLVCSLIARVIKGDVLVEFIFYRPPFKRTPFKRGIVCLFALYRRNVGENTR